jgi:hypothetical protein
VLFHELLLNSRIKPASLPKKGLMRIVDDTRILYFSGPGDELQLWAQDINSRFTASPSPMRI